MTSASCLTRVRTLIDEAQNNGTGAITSISLAAGGSGYSVAQRLPVYGGNSNAYVEVMGVDGQVSTVAVNAAGQNYVIGDLLTIVAGNSDCILEVLTLIGASPNGVSTVKFHSTNHGTGYSVASGLSTTTNSVQGSGCKINVTAVTSAVTSLAILVPGTGYTSKTGVTTDQGGCTLNILEVASANYWTDTEIYASLTDGQEALCNLALSVYRAKKQADPDTPVPYLLQPLYDIIATTLGTGHSSIALSNPVLELISLKYNHNAASPLYSVRFRNLSSAAIFQQDNTYLSITGTEYYARFYNNDTISLETASTSAASAYSAEVLIEPTDITASVDPIIPDVARDAIAYFAFSQMLSKDQRSQEAQQALQVFFQLSQSLIS
jgi:hypothetical protein